MMFSFLQCEVKSRFRITFGEIWERCRKRYKKNPEIKVRPGKQLLGFAME